MCRRRRVRVGKSSLGLTVAGLIEDSNGRITDGSVRFGGVELVGLSPREMRNYRGQRIGMIFQNARASLNPVRTIGSQLAETLQSAGSRLTRAEVSQRAVELFELVGIPDPLARLDAYPHQLSGGMCQRIMIALAIAQEPRLLIADEPTSALDVTVKVQILQLLKKLNRDLGMAMLLITHDFGVARALADTIAVVYAGQIVERGPAAQVLESPQMPYTQALLASIPHLRGQATDRLPAIAGRPPSLVNPPHGCRFVARCAHVEDVCASPAELRLVSPQHAARCHFPHLPMFRPSQENGGQR